MWKQIHTMIITDKSISFYDINPLYHNAQWLTLLKNLNFFLQVFWSQLLNEHITLNEQIIFWKVSKLHK